ncbi:hypothetical protein [Photobacterium damselae]|uniref:DUF2157 domain-containing protein n=1 Tax=Photobacterium damselae subsp. damselae TaxID=85581 RepID=E4WL92_PHODD|nr:hypothetical protein [Photobacterium damselae]NVO72869.1 hypothetical protein [Photobacterium damselae subsp. damselae]QSH59577.1 hypothetical protein A0J47_020090 [Photobacterium damselae subsp. damselae]CBX86810.1 hypothetical protein [Photobacterium damselae subsp. damselae]SPY31197.1 Uncharacterised protein [Photobacterium damselae]
MTEKLGTLTAKIDALRAKGFSDDEINQLLSSSMPAEAPESPFNIGEIFNNGASKEEWNQQVDETEQLYVKQMAIFIGCLGFGMISVGFSDYLYPREWARVIFAISMGACAIVMAYFAPKNREKIKFFIKKRR